MLPNFSSVRHSVIQQHSFLSTIHLPTPLLITLVRPVSQEEETQRDFQRLHPTTGLTAKTTGEKVTQPPSLDGALMGKNPCLLRAILCGIHEVCGPAAGRAPLPQERGEAGGRGSGHTGRGLVKPQYGAWSSPRGRGLRNESQGPG